MAKRVQLIVKDSEYRAIQRAARSRQLSVAEWVRQALNLARRGKPENGADKKLRIIRAAARFEFPTGDLES